MALDSNALILPGRGTVFVGDPDTTPPTATALAAINPLLPPAGWECIGHTSRENTVGLSKDGGDATQLGSWWDEAIDTSYDPVNWSITVNSLQVDALTLGLAFGGGTLDDVAGFYDFDNAEAQERAMLVLMVGGTKRMGVYLPKTSITLGDGPEVATDAFFEIQLSGQILNSDVTGKRIRFIKPSLIATP